MNTNEITHPAPDLMTAESAELLTPLERIEARHVDRLNELLAEQRALAQVLGCEPGEVRQRVEGLHFALRQIVAMTSPMGTDSGDAGVYRVASAALAELRKPASEPQVLRRPVHACGIEGKTACGLAIENNHTESDPILRGPLYESVTCEACIAGSRKAEEG